MRCFLIVVVVLEIKPNSFYHGCHGFVLSSIIRVIPQLCAAPVLLCISNTGSLSKSIPNFNASQAQGLVLPALKPMSNPLSTEINGIPCVRKDYAGE